MGTAPGGRQRADTARTCGTRTGRVGAGAAVGGVQGTAGASRCASPSPWRVTPGRGSGLQGEHHDPNEQGDAEEQIEEQPVVAVHHGPPWDRARPSAGAITTSSGAEFRHGDWFRGTEDTM